MGRVETQTTLQSPHDLTQVRFSHQAPELQPVGAVHPSLHGFGTLGRAGKLGSGATVIESRPAEPAVDPGDLILPGKQDDADTKWQLFKL